ncbi:hypothetical protein Tco_0827055 [Tanacetum coccineum]
MDSLATKRGGDNYRVGEDGTSSDGKGGVGDLHLLRDGPTDGGGNSEAYDDEYINTLRLLQGGVDDDECDVFDDGDEGRDLLRDGPECGDDGADEDPNEEPNDNGDGTADPLRNAVSIPRQEQRGCGWSGTAGPLSPAVSDTSLPEETSSGSESVSDPRN